MYYFHLLRRKLIRFLIRDMEVCTNMTINGTISYYGKDGGVINSNNKFE